MEKSRCGTRIAAYYTITTIYMLVQYDWWLDPGQSRLQAVVLRRWILGV
ncbi:hypothetical protein Hanom_Chr05g00392311 [Helianthus anomalus]